MGIEERHIKTLSRLDDDHVRRLDEALAKLEQSVIRVTSKLPITDGKLHDLTAAISARQQLREAFQSDLLRSVNGIVVDYDEAAASVVGLFDQASADGLIISQADNIKHLKKLTFQGFEEIANTHLETLSRNIYQATIAGKALDDVVMDIRHAINGVYIQSDNDAAQVLVDFVRTNTGVADKAEAVQEAIDKLHTIYARDKVGANLRRYAVAYAHDALMQFSASVNVSTAIELGAERWKYYGTTMGDTRDFCIRHEDKVMTTEEIREIWANETWAGKSAGDPFIVRGGYNCRHHFRAVFGEL